MKWRPRLSLLNLVLLTTIVSLAVPLWQYGRRYQRLSVRVEQLDNQVTQLRAEAGYLDVPDPKRLYALPLRAADDTWEWKVHLPAGKEYWLCSHEGELPAAGKVPDGNASRGLVGSPHSQYRKEAEQSIRVAVRRDSKGRLVLAQSFGPASASFELPSDVTHLMRANRSSTAEPTRLLMTTPPSEPLILLRDSVTRSSSGESNTQYVLLIWLEEMNSEE